MNDTRFQVSNTGTPTHPHLAVIQMDPADCAKFHRAFEDQPEVRQIDIDRSAPDVWTVYAACASQSVCDLLESNW